MKTGKAVSPKAAIIAILCAIALCTISPLRADNDDTWKQSMTKINSLLSSGKIRFETGSAVLTPKSRKMLDELAVILKQRQDIRLIIEGHTDSQGKASKNQALSKARAMAVMGYLLGKGTDQSRLKAVGHGESRPIATNRTAAGRARNRRIDFIVNQIKTAPKPMPAAAAHKTPKTQPAIKAQPPKSNKTARPCNQMWSMGSAGQWERNQCDDGQTPAAATAAEIKAASNDSHETVAETARPAPTSFCGDRGDMGPPDQNAPKWMTRRRREGLENCEIWVSIGKNGAGLWKPAP